MVSIEPFNFSNPWTLFGYAMIAFAVVMIPEINKTASQLFYNLKNTYYKKDLRVQEIDSSAKVEIWWRGDNGEMFQKTGEEELEIMNYDPSMDVTYYSERNPVTGKAEVKQLYGTPFDYDLKVYLKTEDGRTREEFGSKSRYRVNESARLGKDIQIHWFDHSTSVDEQAYRSAKAMYLATKDRNEQLLGGHYWELEQESTAFGKALDKVKPKYMLPTGKKTPLEVPGGEGGSE